MFKSILLVFLIITPFSCHADSSWRPIATHATMLAMILFINLVFLGGLYVLSIIKAARSDSQLVKQEQEAQFDFLTQVLNRRGFERRIADSQKLQGYILVVDIDDFKKINDGFGHQAGDYVLQKVAASIKGALREQDIIGRFGGEEFIIYAALEDKNAAEELSNRLVDTIGTQPYAVPGLKSSLRVTISVGVSSVHESINVSDKTTRKEVLSSAFKTADSNLYEAKRAGKNQAVLSY